MNELQDDDPLEIRYFFPNIKRSDEKKCNHKQCTEKASITQKNSNIRKSLHTDPDIDSTNIFSNLS